MSRNRCMEILNKLNDYYESFLNIEISTNNYEYYIDFEIEEADYTVTYFYDKSYSLKENIDFIKMIINTKILSIYHKK